MSSYIEEDYIMEIFKDNEIITSPSWANKVEAANKIDFSLAEINKMLDAWQKEEKLFLSENAIKSLFDDETNGISHKEEKELCKICLVNQVYGTNLYLDDIVQLAKYLSENAGVLNEKLHAGNIEIINDITCSIKDTRGKYCYSFATKYCGFAAPEKKTDSFPIYDSYMSALYKTRADFWNPNKVKGFYKYDFDSWEGNPEHDNRRYGKYREAVYMMRDEIANVKNLTIKQLDQYLWKAMKDYSTALANNPC